MAPEVLQRALAGIEVYRDPNVLVGYETADDAGVYRFDEQTALVQTVDFFTPIVDDPYTYGQIAASNSLSDIYAMGGTPRFALSIVGFPADDVEESVLHEILRGGSEKMKEAAVAVIGGHSVRDREIKFGYCVTGTVSVDKVYKNSCARVGDVLLLTKPLGIGIIATGVKFSMTSPEVEKQAVAWMLKLNRPAVHHLNRYRVHAVTDITGYGLIGHAFEMAAGSRVTLALKVADVPTIDGVVELAEKGMLPGGIESNRKYVGDAIAWNGAPVLRQQILLDPQTSGGLLISVTPEEAESLAQDLESEGFLGQKIGHVVELQDRYIQVE